MANNLKVNPALIDTQGATSTMNNIKLRLLQWVDDNGDLVHDSTLVLTINQVDFTVKIQPLNNDLAFGAVAWQLGPFSPGIALQELTVKTMATGQVHIWR